MGGGWESMGGAGSVTGTAENGRSAGVVKLVFWTVLKEVERQRGSFAHICDSSWSGQPAWSRSTTGGWSSIMTKEQYIWKTITSGYLWRAFPLPDQTPTIFVSIHSSFHVVFSDTYKISSRYVENVHCGYNNRFNHMLVVVYRSLVPSLSHRCTTCTAQEGEAGHVVEEAGHETMVKAISKSAGCQGVYIMCCAINSESKV